MAVNEFNEFNEFNDGGAILLDRPQCMTVTATMDWSLIQIIHGTHVACQFYLHANDTAPVQIPAGVITRIIGPVVRTKLVDSVQLPDNYNLKPFLTTQLHLTQKAEQSTDAYFTNMHGVECMVVCQGMQRATLYVNDNIIASSKAIDGKSIMHLYALPIVAKCQITIDGGIGNKMSITMLGL